MWPWRRRSLVSHRRAGPETGRLTPDAPSSLICAADHKRQVVTEASRARCLRAGSLTSRNSGG